MVHNDTRQRHSAELCESWLPRCFVPGSIPSEGGHGRVLHASSHLPTDRLSYSLSCMAQDPGRKKAPGSSSTLPLQNMPMQNMPLQNVEWEGPECLFGAKTIFVAMG